MQVDHTRALRELPYQAHRPRGVLLCLFIVAMITIGSCIGIVHLMIYFMPTITLGNVLVPAAILTTVLIVMFGGMLKLWFIDGIKRNAPIMLDYEEEEEAEEKSKSSTVTRINTTP